MKRILVCLFAAFVWLPPASALELRQCDLRVVFTGKDVAATELPRSRFRAWSRADTERNALGGLANITRYCGQIMVFGNYRAIPKYCRDKPQALLDSKKLAAGLTGFKFTMGREALKAAVCKSPSLGKVKAPDGEGAKMDKRVIPGFRLYLTRVAGAACTDQDLTRVMTLTVFCKTPKDAKVRDRRGGAGWTLYRVVE